MGALIIAKNKRIDWIDTAKGIGIILVVFAHTKFFEEIDTSALNFLAYQIYSFHMPLFFIISGICLCISEERSVSISCDFHSRIKKITKRLLPPYFLWSVVYIVINLILGIVNNEATLVRRIGGNIYATLTGRGMAPLWFLFSLWVAEILVLYINYWIGGATKGS